VFWHFSSLHDCKPGQLMSQLLAWHTIGSVEQALAPEQVTLQELPAQFTPFRQLESPHVTSHDEALLQSTPLLQLSLAHSTRHGMPVGQSGMQSGVSH
jgi:hypothetical protein